VGDNTAVLLANQTIDIAIDEAGKITVNRLRGISEREYQRGQQIQDTINALAVANNWDEQYITPPRQFDQETPITQMPAAATESPCLTQHVVGKGETLGAIARQYNTTVQAIVQANQIVNPNLINPGLTLCIPRPT
jgi:LysM repeat protein